MIFLIPSITLILLIGYLFHKQYFGYLMWLFKPTKREGEKRDRVILILLSLILVIILVQLFDISLVNTGFLIIIFFIVFFVVFTCKAQDHENRKYFTELNSFLSYFLMSFSQNKNIYASLIDISDHVNVRFKETHAHMIASCKTGEGTQEAYQALLMTCNHFIVHNIFNYMESVQSYGDTDNIAVFQNLQKDLDDWFEDTITYRNQLIRILNKIKVLIVFSIVICFFAKNMLVQVGLELNNSVYQTSIYIFIFTLLVTLLMSYLSISNSWIEVEECIS